MHNKSTVIETQKNKVPYQIQLLSPNIIQNPYKKAHISSNRIQNSLRLVHSTQQTATQWSAVKQSTEEGIAQISHSV
jgi:hypothetical protein